jgi:hypothetical protein
MWVVRLCWLCVVQADELSACIEALECRLSGTTDPQQQQRALHDCLQTLQQLQQQEDAAAAATHALRKQLQQLQQQQVQLDKQLKSAEQQLKAAQKQAAQAAAAIKDAASEAQKLQQEVKQIAQEFSVTDAVQANWGSILAAPSPAGEQPHALPLQPAATSAAAAEEREVTQAQLQQLRRGARQLQAKLSRLAVPELLPGQKVRYGNVCDMYGPVGSVHGLEGALFDKSFVSWQAGTHTAPGLLCTAAQQMCDVGHTACNKVWGCTSRNCIAAAVSAGCADCLLKRHTL